MTDHCFGFRKLNTCTGARAQAGALLTNQIAPDKRAPRQKHGGYMSEFMHPSCMPASSIVL